MFKLLFTICFMLCMNAFSQKALNVLDWKSEYTVNTYLIQQMQQQYAERKNRIEAAVTTKAKALSYIAECRKRYLALLGDRPDTSALNTKITGTISKDAYRIEKLYYESFKNLHVTASLYIPNSKGPRPAVLFFCGHEDVSKATVSYQQTAILFAKHGFVVLVVDPISQSERYQLTDAEGKPLTRGGTTEHTLLNAGSNLVGSSTPAYELWDNVRSLDYLVTRPEVDTARIGCLGNSGGGMQTIYFAGFDTRIKVMAPCSYLATRGRTLEISGAADGCAQIPGEGNSQLELNDYLAIAAPKPLLVLAGRYDFIDYTGTLTSFTELQKLYKVLGEQERISLFTVDDGHGISKPKREAVVSWFSRWLKNDASPVKETEITALSDKELFATATGQVNTSFPDEVTIPARNLSLYETLAARRQFFLNSSKQSAIQTIARIAGINHKISSIEITEKGTIIHNNILFHKIIIRKEQEPPVPVLVVYPEAGTIKKVIGWFNEAGKNRIADSAALVNNYLQQGYAVVMADLRGIGETEDKPELNDPKYFNKEYRNAMLALHIGRSLVGQRATDVLSVMGMINENQQLKGLPVELNASGSSALAVLHAMLLNNKAEKINIYEGIQSFKEMLSNSVQKNYYSYIVPGALNYYDIPNLVTLLGKQKIVYIQ